MSEQRVYLKLPEFTGKNVPINEIARVIGKDCKYVRVGIQQGFFLDSQ